MYIAIAGNIGAGKTTLTEAMLFLAGASDRLGKVSEGNTVCDFDPEEVKRQTSVASAVAPIGATATSNIATQRIKINSFFFISVTSCFVNKKPYLPLGQVRQTKRSIAARRNSSYLLTKALYHRSAVLSSFLKSSSVSFSEI